MDTDHDYPRRVAEVVKETADRLGISTKALSERTGIPRVTLIRKLSGAHGSPLTLRELVLIAPHIHMTPLQISQAADDRAAA